MAPPWRALPFTGRAAHAETAASARAPFWGWYLDTRDLMRWDPDAAGAVADSLLERDTDDFLGRVLRGALRSSRDSARAEESLRDAQSRPEPPGAQVEAGVILLARNRTEEGRAALDRARAGYRTRARPVDECRAVLWKFKHAWDRGNAAPYFADIAEAESLARRAGDPGTLADVLILKGGNATRRDMALARRAFEEAYQLLAPLGPSRQLAGAHRGLGLCLERAADRAGAGRHYREALQVAEARRDSFQAFSALAGLGRVQKAAEDFGAARATLESARGLAFAMKDTRAMSQALSELAGLHFDAGDYPEARESYLAALRVMDEAHLETDNKPVVLTNLGMVEQALGDYEVSRSRFEQALSICRRRDIKVTMVDLLHRLARLHRELGDLQQARRLSDEALAMQREASVRAKLGTVLAERARILIEVGEPAEALEVAREGEAFARATDPRDLWHLVLTEAAALEKLGRGAEGIAVLDSMLAGAPQVADSSHLQSVLLLEGALLLRSGQVDRSLAALERGMAIARAIGTPGHIADARLTVGATLLAAQRPAEAAAALEQGLSWFESVQSAVRASQERSAYQASWHDSYVTLARAYVAMDRPGNAFATMERSRGRELRRLFLARAASARRRLPVALAAQVARVESDLDASQATLLHQHAQPVNERSPGLARLERRVDSLRTEWEALNRRLQREAPAYARAAGLLPTVGAAAARRALGEDERLLAFMVGADVTLVFDVTRGALRVHELALPEDSLASHVETVLRGLREGSGEAARPAAAKLARGLLGATGLARHPPGVLYVVPDGALHHLPFEALPLGATAAGRGRLLVEASQVIYAGSATMLLTPPAGRSPPGPSGAPLVAFGDPAGGGEPSSAVRGIVERGALAGAGPLPYARREVQALSARFPGARTYVGESATEARFYEEAARTRRLHVAAHAFVDERHPEFSGIVLAQSPKEGAAGRSDDGLVQAYEVMERDLDLDLVVLSACESGLGRLQRGEGLIGLSRAFRLAGARNLIVSLWKVDDAATAAVMDAFYARLAAGGSPAAALRGAKLSFLAGGGGGGGKLGAPGGAGVAATPNPRGVAAVERGERLAAPSTWAAFVLVGAQQR